MSLSVLLVSLFTFVQFNSENLFDCQHDSLKNDVEFLPDGSYHWTPYRYWRKLNRVGQTIVSCGDRVGGDDDLLLKISPLQKSLLPDGVCPIWWRCARWRTTL